MRFTATRPKRLIMNMRLMMLAGLGMEVRQKILSLKAASLYDYSKVLGNIILPVRLRFVGGTPLLAANLCEQPAPQALPTVGSPTLLRGVKGFTNAPIGARPAAKVLWSLTAFELKACTWMLWKV